MKNLLAETVDALSAADDEGMARIFRAAVPLWSSLDRPRRRRLKVPLAKLRAAAEQQATARTAMRTALDASERFDFAHMDAVGRSYYDAVLEVYETLAAVTNAPDLVAVLPQMWSGIADFKRRWSDRVKDYQRQADDHADIGGAIYEELGLA